MGASEIHGVGKFFHRLSDSETTKLASQGFDLRASRESPSGKNHQIVTRLEQNVHVSKTKTLVRVLLALRFSPRKPEIGLSCSKVVTIW